MSTLKVTNISPQSGSNVHITGSTHVTGNLVVSETIIAKELRTELTQSVVLFQSGSTQFGDSADDTHQFTGSVNVSGSLGTQGTFSNEGDLKVTGSLLLSGSDFIFTGSTAQMLLKWPASPNEFHFLQTNPFTVNNPVLGNRTYEYAAWALDHYESGSGAYHNAFKWYMFDSEDKNFGNEILLSPYLIRSLVIASGSNNVAFLTLRDQADGTTAARLDANQIYIGDNQSQISIRGELALVGQITSSNGIYVSGSLTVVEGVNAEGGFTGSADFDTLVNKPTLISSSAQIAADISGSFVATSASIASDIATNVVANESTASFASTGSNTYTGNQIVSASVLLTLQQLTGSMPTGVATGSLIVSGSPVQLYIYNGSGSGWNRV